MESTQGFHAIMNLILMPIWILSGAFFPASGAAGWLGWLMQLNPLTYGMAALRRCLYLGSPSRSAASRARPSLAVTAALLRDRVRGATAVAHAALARSRYQGASAACRPP
jgi:ABC-2 type transport system permease protein